MIEWLHAPGFLGTAGNRAADLTLTASLFVASLFTVGFALARRGAYEAHRWVQTAAAGLNLVLVAWMMILPFRDFVLPGLPGRLAERFYGVTSLHAAVGASALLFGWFVVLRGHGLVPRPLHFRRYKPMMRLAYGLYMAATLLGVLVYLTWFVGNPDPPTF